MIFHEILVVPCQGNLQTKRRWDSRESGESMLFCCPLGQCPKYHASDQVQDQSNLEKDGKKLLLWKAIESTWLADTCLLSKDLILCLVLCKKKLFERFKKISGEPVGRYVPLTSAWFDPITL